jgi:hypothetical protein
MKTNVSIELDKAQRDYLATLIDGKVTKRLASRSDITKLVNQFIGGTIAQAEYSGGKADIPESQSNYNPSSDLYSIDPEDRKFLDGKDPSYVRGWNQVKRDAK